MAGRVQLAVVTPTSVLTAAVHRVTGPDPVGVVKTTVPVGVTAPAARERTWAATVTVPSAP